MLIHTHMNLTSSRAFSPVFRARVRTLLSLFLVAGLTCSASAQMVSGEKMKDFAKVFGETTNRNFEVNFLSCSAPSNILWPGEQAHFQFQIVSSNGEPLRGTGRVRLVTYATKGIENDIWTPQVVGGQTLASLPIQVDVKAGGFQNISVSPMVPAKLGAYALMVDFDGASQFLTPFVRTFRADARRVQYPKFCLDALPLPVLQRLGVKAIRYGVSYKPTTDADFNSWYAEQGAYLNSLKGANIAVLFMVGGGAFNDPNQPLGRPRPWLDEKGVMQDTKFDLAWLPSYDRDFQEYTRRFATDFGWPRGPINAFSLWNEPWEGISISGWGADMLRYRDMYRHMARGVLEARKTGVQVLVGGGDSSSNAHDKFFPDGSNEFLPIFDFLSIHYQGLDSTANTRAWRERKGANGRVKIWDTESWVANTDDRVATVVAANRAAGYDRAMGIYGGNVASENRPKIRTGNGEREIETVGAWSVAAAIGASQHFLGERPFKQMLFRNGLPWVMEFDGENGRPEDGTLVVVGDLGDAFGADGLLFRTARGEREVAHKTRLKAELAALPASDKRGRVALLAALSKPETLSGATMTIKTAPGFGAFDFYGNPLPAQNGTLTIPLDAHGVFLRAGKEPGSFARLVEAVRASSIRGIEPLATVARDFTALISNKPQLRLELTNVLNCALRGDLKVSVRGLKLQSVPTLAFKAGETKIVKVQVLSGATRADNSYPLNLRFDAGRDGVAVHEETLHVNVVARRIIKVDGDLDDWRGVAPQTILTDAQGGPSLTEAAWYSFKNLGSAAREGIAVGYLAYDAKNFYFAAKIADSTPNEGMVRFATRNDDNYFYPPVSFAQNNAGANQNFSARWTGEIEAPASGEYRLITASDDGARLWLDDKLLLDHWNSQAETEYGASVTLKARQRYRVRMEYFQGDGGTSARLLWQRPGAEKEVIPQRYLFPQSGAAQGEPGTGLRAEYFRGVNLEGAPLATRVDSQVNFNWTELKVVAPEFSNPSQESLAWPNGVRRYSYRKDPDLPAGNAPKADNVQLAFNVLPESRKPMLDTLPGLPPRFTHYSDTDYEYALNPVAAKYGGGTEIWRLRVPGMPSKHFYPRQPKSRFDGPVKAGQLVVKHGNNVRLVEAAIPWSEMPDVKARLDADLPIKFSFRVNDDQGSGTMELARGRSVSKRNSSTFHVEWVQHWANELEFGWGK